MKNYFLLALMALGTGYGLNAQTNVQTADKYSIQGNLKGLTDPIIYMRYQEGDSIKLDSSKVVSSSFKFKGSAESPRMAVIYLMNKKGGFQFYLENAPLKINGNVDSLDKVQIKGSATQDDFNTYQSSIQDLNDQQSTAYTSYQQAKQNGDEATASKMESQLNDLDSQMSVRTKQFISVHPKSVVSLDMLQSLAYSTPYNELNPLFTTLDTKLKESAKGEKISKLLDVMKKTDIGQPAADFSLNDVNGKLVKLSDFKGKYVLVDFWASWCGPCRAENPNVVKTYAQYKDKNFTILGVSLDNNDAKWKQAIEQDKLTWTHVSDLKGWQSSAAALYGVQGIPANFLIDPNGIIVGHNLRGEDLANKLAELIK